MTRPDILFVMTDQQRFYDTIAALGNSHIYTPNLDRLVRRGITFSKCIRNMPGLRRRAVLDPHWMRAGYDPRIY